MNKVFKFMMLITAILALAFAIYNLIIYIPLSGAGLNEYWLYICLGLISIAIWLLLGFIKVTDKNYKAIKVSSFILSIIASGIYFLAVLIFNSVTNSYPWISITYTDYLQIIILLVLSIIASILIKKPAVVLERKEKHKQLILANQKEVEFNDYRTILVKAKNMLYNGIITKSEHDKIVEELTKNM